MDFFSKVIVVVLAAVASCHAQAMPQCASTCLGTFLAQSMCNATDFACICADTTLMGNAELCTLQSCTIKESLTTLNITNTLCGVPVRDNTVVTPIITSVSGILAIIAIAMRLMDANRRGLQICDGCAVVALVCAIPMGVLEFVMSAQGFGKDIWTIPFDQITNIVKYTWVTEFMYMAALGFTKIAILLFFLQVFPLDGIRRMCWVTLAICVAYVPAFVLATVLHCTPISYTWTSWTGETTGTCTDFNAFAWAHAIINIVLDLWILALPLPQILKLQMGRRKKVHLVVMFCIGLFITIVSIVRLSALVQFATTTNPTYDNVPTAYWSVLEAYVSIICCCLPSVRALLRHVFPSCFGSTYGSGSSDPSYRISTKNTLSSSHHQISKSVTHNVSVSYKPRTADSDSVELMVKDDPQQVRRPEW